ncbi:MAG: CotH kinase family protein [Butyrivibrio sp.]
MRKFILTGISFILMIMMVACASTKPTTETTKKTAYSIVPKTFQKENADIPKVYIDTTGEANREEYINSSVRISDGSGQYEEIYSDNVGLKVRGHTTAYGEKVPYNIRFEEKVNVLGMGNSKKWCLLANLFDPTMMRNTLALDFARNMGMEYTSKCEYVELIYNGVDQGGYLLCTPVSEGKDKVDLDLSENDYLLQLQPNYTYSDKELITTNGGMILSIEEGNTDDLTYLTEFMLNFENSIGYGLEEFSKYADVDSFVDFYVFYEIVKDVDFSTSSTFFYIKDDKLYAGPVWDCDLSMGNINEDYYTDYSNGSECSYEGFYCQKLWFWYLIFNPEFQNKVKERFMELQPLIENLTTDNELGRNRIDDIIDKYGSDFNNNFTIWEEGKRYGAHGMVPLATFEENVEYLRQWIINRNEWLKNQWSN